MQFELESITQFLLPVGIIMAGLAIGLIVEHFVLRKIARFAAATTWHGDEVVARALRGLTTLWLVIGAIAVAIHVAPLSSDVVARLQTILLVTLTISLTIAAARLTSGFITLYAGRTQALLPSTSTSFFTNFSKLIIYIVGSLVVLSILGIPVAPIITALGIGGLAVALALQDPLSNLFSGLQLIITRPIKPGDYVMISSGEAGYVVDITWRNTTIRELADNLIIIPNSKLATAIIKNYYQPEKPISVLVEVGVSYGSDLAMVEQVTIEVAREVMQEIPGGIPDFEPFIRYHTFADFSINFTVILRATTFVDQYLLKHEFVKRLHARYQAEGIEIPFPIRTVYMEGAS